MRYLSSTLRQTERHSSPFRVYNRAPWPLSYGIGLNYLPWIAGVLLLVASILPARAEEIPWLDLAQKGVDTNSLGRFSIEFFGPGRNLSDFNAKAERASPLDGIFKAPAGLSQVAVTPTGIKFADNGVHSNAKEDQWQAVLVFIPKQSGHYRIAGLVKFWCDEHDTQKSVSIQLLTPATKVQNEVAFEQLSQHEGEIDLSTMKELQHLAISEAIGFAISRKVPLHGGGGSITGLKIEKVDPRPEIAPEPNEKK